MTTKDLLALNLLLLGTLAGILVACRWQLMCDVLFFLITAGAVVTERIDVNFLSCAWYRGTTRGLEVSLIDVMTVSLLVSLLLVPRDGQRRWFWPASLAAMLVYFGWCAASVALFDPKLFGLFELSKIARGLVVFLAAALYVRSERELRVLVWALGCVACCEALISLKQRYIGGMWRVEGTLMHPNSLSMYLCLVGPVLVGAANAELPRLLRRFCMACVGATALTMILTVSRAGLPIAGLTLLGVTAFCITGRITAKRVAMTVVIVALMAGALAKAWDTLSERYLSATLREEYLAPEIEGRGYYVRVARAIWKERPFGVGLNNWSYWVSKKYGEKELLYYADYDSFTESRRADASAKDSDLYDSRFFAAPAHNLALLTIGELGWVGLLLFAAVWARWFQVGSTFLRIRTTDPMRQIAVGIFFGVLGVFLQSLTEWSFRLSAIHYTSLLLLGVLAALHHRKRETARSQPAAALVRPAPVMVH